MESKENFNTFKTINMIPLAIGLTVGISLYFAKGWWGFLILFPWIGLAITIGFFLKDSLPEKDKNTGRRVSILMVMPALLIFLPAVNSENLQIESIIFLASIGYFSKGIIHYAIAKVFGPLIWGRGFCGWACWTAAILEWLPIKKGDPIPKKLWNLRYFALIISIALPLYVITVLSYDVHGNYLGKDELAWMIGGNLIYYALAIPLAFVFNDRRAFCKIACPVSLIMKVPTNFAKVKIKPTGNLCTECGLCSKVCLMDIDVQSFISNKRPITSTECILCNTCTNSCPTGAIG